MNWLKALGASRWEPGILRSLVTYYGKPGQLARMKRFYRQFLGPGSLALDIGSHVGNRSFVFASLGARVVALEPQPNLFRVMEAILPPQVQRYPWGAGPQEDSLALYRCKRFPTLTTLDPQWVERMGRNPLFKGISWEESDRVPVTTLDRIIEDHGMPDFVKIDVEGYEAQVLKGLSHPVRALSFELLPADKDNALACVDRLEHLASYEYQVSAVEHMRFALDSWVPAEEIRQFIEAKGPTDRSGDVYARLIGDI